MAGNPESYRYDPDTRTYTLTFTTHRGVDGPTEIALPKDVYAKPPTIQITGPGRTHTDTRNNTAGITTAKDGRYTITITPTP
ncbi:hypothetical protein [Embleya sp. NPDC005575]|uniref:hypothetical protein n=1 Tax=Embleya sp. NPDC005575 TaxID=3156892 RepID=UPI0033B65CC9